MAKTINAIDQHVGNRVRLQHRSLGLTQQQLARAVGVTFQQIGFYENGINRVSASRLEQIAKALGVAPSFFFEQGVTHHRVPAEEMAATLLATAEGVELIEAFSRIRCPRMRRTVIGIIEQLAEAAIDGPI
ncbi:helix-turn-helix domain-containing protein [Bosea sp. LjRoot90]|uniref:helix-turn-helix domain-containing protein n=1 Tax=Bosea sp. LjRoot90 TaxID=3342342 RepID=UPI003ED006E8